MTSRTLPRTPSLGVCYYPEHLPADYWAADFDSMREIGIRLVRLGEFAWSRLEPDPGEYRFSWLDQILDLNSLSVCQPKISGCSSNACTNPVTIRPHPFR